MEIGDIDPWRSFVPPGQQSAQTGAIPIGFAALKDPLSRAYYDRKRAQGKKHNQALIALARRRCNVLFAMLRDGAYFHVSLGAAAA